jgi:hypothetical protein
VILEFAAEAVAQAHHASNAGKVAHYRDSHSFAHLFPKRHLPDKEYEVAGLGDGPASVATIGCDDSRFENVGDCVPMLPVRSVLYGIATDIAPIGRPIAGMLCNGCCARLERYLQNPVPFAALFLIGV